LPSVRGILANFRFFFYSFDSLELMYVHAERDHASCKFWLQPLSLAVNTGFHPRRIPARAGSGGAQTTLCPVLRDRVIREAERERSADTSAVLPISAVQVPGQRTNDLLPRDLPAAPLDSQDIPGLVLAGRLNGIKCLI
jgi:hypothetical protein